MSIFWGIYSPNPIADHFMGAMASRIRRMPEEPVFEMDTPHFKLMQLDIRAFGTSGVHRTHEICAALAGDPIREGAPPGNRYAGLEQLATDIENDSPEVALNRCQGSHALCHYNQLHRQLLLATDKAGVRPLYYLFRENCLFFSTCLKSFTGLGLDLKRNTTALVEAWSFGVPLGRNTFYQDIQVLADGEYLVWNDRDVAPRILSYHEWDKIPREADPQAPTGLYQRFSQAVKDRCPPSEGVVSFLSGGLDSRCIASALKEQGKRVTALNSYQPGEQDQAFAREFARHATIELISLPRKVNTGITRDLLANTIARARTHGGSDFPCKFIFSGDGGSVPMGHVYLEPSLVQKLESGDLAGARVQFLEKRKIPARILKHSPSKDLLTHSKKILKRELEQLKTRDGLQAFFLFLLKNDQRRHLHGYYEDMDIIRTELALPFFDGRLLEKIVSLPRAPFLYHGLYHEWLKEFPKETRDVPWQTYPGHMPCPIKEKGSPSQAQRSTQWEKNQAPKNMGRRWAQIISCGRRLTRPDFPKDLISRPRVLAFMVLHLTGIKDYSYIFSFCRHLHGLYRDHPVEN